MEFFLFSTLRIFAIFVLSVILNFVLSVALVRSILLLSSFFYFKTHELHSLAGHWTFHCSNILTSKHFFSQIHFLGLVMILGMRSWSFVDALMFNDHSVCLSLFYSLLDCFLCAQTQTLSTAGCHVASVFLLIVARTKRLSYLSVYSNSRKRRDTFTSIWYLPLLVSFLRCNTQSWSLHQSMPHTHTSIPSSYFSFPHSYICTETIK